MIKIAKKPEIQLWNEQIHEFFESLVQKESFSAADKEIKEQIYDVFKENRESRSNEDHIKKKIAEVLIKNPHWTELKDINDLYHQYKEFLRSKGKLKKITDRIMSICEKGNERKKDIVWDIIKKHGGLFEDEKKLKNLDILIEGIRTSKDKILLEIPEKEDSYSNPIECLLILAEKCTEDQIKCFWYLYHIGIDIGYTVHLDELISFIGEKPVKYFQDKEYLFEQYKKIYGRSIGRYQLADFCNWIDQNSDIWKMEIGNAFTSAAIIAHVFKEALDVKIDYHTDDIIEILTDPFFIAELKDINAWDVLFVTEKIKEASKDENIQKNDNEGISLWKAISLISLCKKKRYTDKRIKEMHIEINKDTNNYSGLMNEIFYSIYGRKPYPDGYSREKEEEEDTIMEKYGLDQLKKNITNYKEILEYFNISLEPRDLRYGYEWEKVNKNLISPLYYLSKHPSIKEFIKENFKIESLRELKNTIEEIEKQEKNNKGYLKKLEVINGFYDDEKINMNAVYILLNKEYSVEFIQRLVQLKKDTWYDIIVHITKDHHAESKLWWSIKERFEDSETYQKAKEVWFFTEFNDRSSDHTSNVFKYPRIKNILKDKNFLEFLTQNNDLGFVSLALDSDIEEMDYDFTKKEYIFKKNYLKEIYEEEKRTNFKFMNFAKKIHLIDEDDIKYNHNACIKIIKDRNKVKSIFNIIFKDTDAEITLKEEETKSIKYILLKGKTENLQLILNIITNKPNASIEQIIADIGKLKEIIQEARTENLRYILEIGIIEIDDLLWLEYVLKYKDVREIKIIFDELSEKNSKDVITTYMKILLSNDFSEEKTRELMQEEETPLIQYLCYERLLESQKIVMEDIQILMTFINNEEYTKKIATYLGRQNREPYEMMIETIIGTDLELKELFHNEKKLWGATKRRVVENIAEYIKWIAQNWTKESVNEQISNKLKEVAKIYQSSDSSPVDKICLFIDQFDPLACQCPDLKEKLKNIEWNDKKTEAYKIIREDTKEILEKSGNGDMLKFFKRTGETDKYKEMLELLKKIDQKNRENYSRFTTNPWILLEAWDMTHGTRSVDILPYIIDSWNLAGELLKENRTRDCTPFGIDVIETTEGSIIKIEDDSLDFEKTMKNQANRWYGSNGLFFLYKKEVVEEYKSKNRLYPWVMWSTARLVRTWIPTTEISAIIVPQTADFEAKKETVRKTIAAKWIFIPVFDIQGKPLLTPEEFDEMEVFYYQLSKRGYNMNVIDAAYKYYLEHKDKQDDKHGIVMHKAFQYFKEHADMEQSDDFVIIISFLKNNDLNTYPLERYKKPENTFKKMLDVIKRNIFSKALWKARNTFFEYPPEFDSTKRLSLNEWIELIKKIKLHPHGFVDNFIDNQLQYIDQDTYPQQEKEAEEKLKELLFFDSAKRGNIDVENILQISKYFTRKKKELMVKLRKDVRNQSYEGKDPKKIKLYKDVLIPVITGSGWRWEITLGSDLDYALFVDDEHLPPEVTDKEIFIKELSEFVNNDLSNNINKILGEKGIRADAGLGKKDRRPFSLVSTIKNMKINLQENRQEEEPTEIIVNEPLFDEHKEIIHQIKEDLIVHSPDKNILDSFISRDLEIGWNKKSFVDSFLEIQRKMVSWEAKEDEMIGYIKEGLQRVICFKLAYLLFTAFEQWYIDTSKVKEIPSDTIWLIDFLYSNKIIRDHEMQVSKELWAITYKLRFVGEVYSPQWKEKNQLLKVKNISLKIDEISYNERKRLIELLQEFKDHIIYK